MHSVHSEQDTSGSHLSFSLLHSNFSGRLYFVPHLFKSLHWGVVYPPLHSDHSHSHLSVHAPPHNLVKSGRFVGIKHSFVSVHSLFWTPLTQPSQPEHCHFDWHLDCHILSFSTRLVSKRSASSLLGSSPISINSSSPSSIPTSISCLWIPGGQYLTKKTLGSGQIGDEKSFIISNLKLRFSGFFSSL